MNSFHLFNDNVHKNVFPCVTFGDLENKNVLNYIVLKI